MQWPTTSRSPKGYALALNHRTSQKQVAGAEGHVGLKFQPRDDSRIRLAVVRVPVFFLSNPRSIEISIIL